MRAAITGTIFHASSGGITLIWSVAEFTSCARNTSAALATPSLSVVNALTCSSNPAIAESRSAITVFRAAIARFCFAMCAWRALIFFACADGGTAVAAEGTTKPTANAAATATSGILIPATVARPAGVVEK